MKIAVLGAGMVGRAMAIDLSKKFEVTSIDINEANLQIVSDKGIDIIKSDLAATSTYSTLLEPYDLVICAVPGFMGYKSLEAIINSKKNVVDISFFPENALDLHDLAIQMGVTAIVDCGVAPGLGNFALGYHNSLMQITSFECMVGGLPKKRTFPFEYKAPFSPIDVIEEYTRPARYVENGHIVTKPALSDAELIHFDNIGTLEAFNTDGLRSILHTMKHIPDMKEKTLRYPGHIRLIQALQSAGFFSEEPMTAGDVTLTPLKFTSALLFKQWKLEDGEKEFTVMKIVINGTQNGTPEKIEYRLYDEYDAATQTSSMSRTTGYTCTAAANMIIDGVFTKPGIYPPELVGGENGCFDYILQYLKQRNVHFERV